MTRMPLPRPLLALPLLGFAVGCASDPEPVASPWDVGAARPAALVFTPDIVAGDPVALDLSRAGREPAAFAGYELPTVETSFVRLDDQLRQGPRGNFGRTDKRTVSTQVTTRFR